MDCGRLMHGAFCSHGALGLRLLAVGIQNLSVHGCPWTPFRSWPYEPALGNESSQPALEPEGQGGKFWVRESVERLLVAFRSDPAEQENLTWLQCTDHPEVVEINCRFRQFCDGGGLCSPGRWRPSNRGPPPASPHAAVSAEDGARKWFGQNG